MSKVYSMHDISHAPMMGPQSALSQNAWYRRAKEAEIEKKLVQREEAAMMKEKEYATLDQEVKDTKKKLKKLLHKHEVHPYSSFQRLQ